MTEHQSQSSRSGGSNKGLYEKWRRTKQRPIQKMGFESFFTYRKGVCGAASLAQLRSGSKDDNAMLSLGLQRRHGVGGVC
ncbi:unnamed protein product [Urochloa humidicola]